MEVLFPHTINKTADKAVEDTTNASKTYAQTWREKEKRKKKRQEEKKTNIVKPEGDKHFPCKWLMTLMSSEIASYYKCKKVSYNLAR